MKDKIIEKDENIEYVHFIKRLLIYLVETLLLLVPLVLLYKNTYLLALEYQSSFILLSKWIVLFGFNIFLLVVFGGTIGKLIFRVRVVNAKGEYPTLSQALIRYSLLIASGIIAFSKEIINTGIGPLYQILSNYSSIFNICSLLITLLIFFDGISIFFNKERRAIHDFMADTYVVKKNSSL